MREGATEGEKAEGAKRRNDGGLRPITPPSPHSRTIQMRAHARARARGECARACRGGRLWDVETGRDAADELSDELSDKLSDIYRARACRGGRLWDVETGRQRECAKVPEGGGGGGGRGGGGDAVIIPAVLMEVVAWQRKTRRQPLPRSTHPMSDAIRLSATRRPGRCDHSNDDCDYDYDYDYVVIVDCDYVVMVRILILVIIITVMIIIMILTTRRTTQAV